MIATDFLQPQHRSFHALSPIHLCSSASSLNSQASYTTFFHFSGFLLARVAVIHDFFSLKGSMNFGYYFSELKAHLWWRHFFLISSSTDSGPPAALRGVNVQLLPRQMVDPLWVGKQKHSQLPSRKWRKDEGRELFFKAAAVTSVLEIARGNWCNSEGGQILQYFSETEHCIP